MQLAVLILSSLNKLIIHGQDFHCDGNSHENRMQNTALYMDVQMSFTFINHLWFLHSQKLQSRLP